MPAPHFVYVLRSLKDAEFYIGMTSEIEQRLQRHNAGKVLSTRHRRPFVFLYAETFSSRIEASKREKFLKSGPGHRELNEILATLPF